MNLGTITISLADLPNSCPPATAIRIKLVKFINYEYALSNNCNNFNGKFWNNFWQNILKLKKEVKLEFKLFINIILTWKTYNYFQSKSSFQNQPFAKCMFEYSLNVLEHIRLITLAYIETKAFKFPNYTAKYKWNTWNTVLHRYITK